MQLSQISLAITRLGGLPFSPASLFAAGEQGVWYDPSDLTTLFQDSAGTTPVTAVEQPVGLMRDKSGRGNHATQSTSAKRPVLSARVNLLTKTEAFDDAVWTKTAATVTANAVVAPDGTTTADLITPTAVSGVHAISRALTGTADTYSFTIAIKAQTGSSYNWFRVGLYNGTAYTSLIWFNASTGQVGTVTSGTAITPVNLGNGWWRVGVTSALSTSASCEVNIVPMATDGGSSVYTGDGTSGIYIWGADLRVTNTGVNLPAYQYVNTSTDYSTSGFPLYLKFDGVDDAMASNSIDFTATDKMTVWSGVRKLSDAAAGVVTELSAASGSNAGAFAVFAPSAAAANYMFRSAGTLFTSDNVVTTYTAPITSVMSGQGIISTDTNIIRINGTEVGSNTNDQGAGNYGNYPLYVGARNQTSVYLNGNLYSLIVRGAQSSASQISATETYVNGKTKAYA